MSTTFSKKLTNKISVTLEGKKTVPDAPLFAINWFDTRFAPLYHLYNTLAAPRVFRIGGKAFFKAEVGKQLAGDPSLKRRFLLIVNYPSPTAFLNLIGDPLFQVASLLRTSAVKHFSFCLNRRFEEPQLLKKRLGKHDPSKRYAILHFQGEFTEALKKLITESPLTLHFSSERALTLSLLKEDKNPEQTPAITDKVLLLESDSEEQLERFFIEPLFTETSNKWDEFFAAHLHRLL